MAFTRESYLQLNTIQHVFYRRRHMMHHCTQHCVTKVARNVADDVPMVKQLCTMLQKKELILLLQQLHATLHATISRVDTWYNLQVACNVAPCVQALIKQKQNYNCTPCNIIFIFSFLFFKERKQIFQLIFLVEKWKKIERTDSLHYPHTLGKTLYIKVFD